MIWRYDLQSFVFDASDVLIFLVFLGIFAVVVVEGVSALRFAIDAERWTSLR